MAGGLQGRLLREQIKAQKLQNAQAAMQMASPQQILAEAGLAEALMGQEQARAQGAERFPEELRALMLGNEAREFSNQVAPEVHQGTMDLGNARTEQLQKANMFMEEDREREHEMRQKGLDYARIAGISGLFNTAAAYSDVSDPLQRYLESMGVTGEFKPLQGFGMQDNSAQEAALEQVQKIFEASQQR